MPSPVAIERPEMSDPDKLETYCTSEISLVATDFLPKSNGNSRTVTGQWLVNESTDGIDDPNNNSTTARKLKNGPNVAKWTVTNQITGGEKCSDSKTVSFNVDYFEASIDGPDTRFICDNQIQVVANDPSAYSAKGVWTIKDEPENSGITIMSPNNFTTVVKGLPYGETTLVWTVTSGVAGSTCGDNGGSTKSATLKIINQSLQTDPVTFTVGDDNIAPFTICSDNTTITATPAESGWEGSWSMVSVPNDGQTDLSTSSTANQLKISNIKPAVGDEFTYMWTLTNANAGCTKDYEVTFRNNKFTTYAHFENGKPATEFDNCGASGTLKASQEGVGYWTADEDENTIVITDKGESYESDKTGKWNSQFEFKNNATLAHLTWHAQSNGCTAEAKVTVKNIKPNPSLSPITVCGTSGELSAGSLIANQRGEWKDATNALTFTPSDAATTTVSGIEAGAPKQVTWTVYVKDNDACYTTVNTTVQNTKPIATVKETNVTTCEETYNIEGYGVVDGDDGYTGKWEVTGGVAGAGFGEDNATTTDVAAVTIKNLKYGDNMVKWTLTSKKNKSCFDEVSMHIVNNKVENKGFTNTVTSTCEGTIELTVSKPANNITGKWETTGEGTFGNTTEHSATGNSDNNYKITVSNMGYGLNVFTWTLNNECANTPARIEIYNNQVKAELLEEGPLTSCDGTIILRAKDNKTTYANSKGYWASSSGVNYLFGAISEESSNRTSASTSRRWRGCPKP